MINTFGGGGLTSTVTGRDLATGRIRNKAQAEIDSRNRVIKGGGRQVSIGGRNAVTVTKRLPRPAAGAESAAALRNALATARRNRPAAGDAQFRVKTAPKRLFNAR